MKVLFLDIDGVLNNPKTKERCHGYVGIDRSLSDKLVAWLQKNDIKVVLSSTWRKHPDMHDHIRQAGIDWIAVTRDYCGVLPRGTEIRDYILENPEIKSYAILDDMPEMLPEQTKFFVQTNELTGLTDADLNRLGAIFNG